MVSICLHEWKYAGRANELERAGTTGLGCEQPNVLECRGCHERRVVKCGTTRRSLCEPCGTTYRGRVMHVGRSGMVLGSEGLFVTLTAPGESPHRMPDGRRCPCTPAGGVVLSTWNASLGRRWNLFVTDLRRLLGEVEYFRAVEPQRRGALHVHALLRRRDGRPLRVSVSEVRRLALRHGFGHSVDVQRLEARHAGYAAKYVSKAADGRAAVPWLGWRSRGGTWLDRRTGELVVVERKRVRSFVPTYRTWTSSRLWGRSMSQVREAQAHHALVVSLLPRWDARPSSPAWSVLPVGPVPEWAREPAAAAPTVV